MMHLESRKTIVLMVISVFLCLSNTPIVLAEHHPMLPDIDTSEWEMVHIDIVPGGGHGQAVVTVDSGFLILRQHSNSAVPAIIRVQLDAEAFVSATSVDWTDCTSDVVSLRLETGTAAAWDGDRYVYVLGGSAYTRDRYDVLRFDILTGSWEDSLATAVILDDGVTVAGAQGAGNALVHVTVRDDPYLYAVVGRARSQVSPRARWQPTVMLRHSLKDIPTEWEIVSTFDDEFWPRHVAGSFCTDDGASLVFAGEHLYMLAGSDCTDAPTGLFARFELPLGPWEQLEPLPAINGENDGASLLWDGDQHLYATVGGHCELRADKIASGTEFFRFNLVSQTWTQLSHLPVPLGHYPGNRVALMDDYLFIWQGTNTTCNGMPVEGAGNALLRVHLGAELEDPDMP